MRTKAMSAMQERGRDEWINKLVEWDASMTVQDAKNLTDEILSFAAQREDKARREAIEECIKRLCWQCLAGVPLDGNYHVKKGVKATWQNFGECPFRVILLTLLPSPATEKCEHTNIRNDIASGAVVCNRCGRTA